MVVDKTVQTDQQKGSNCGVSSPSLKNINVSFDDPNLGANADLILVSTLSVSLGLEKLIEDKVSLSGPIGGANPPLRI